MSKLHPLRNMWCDWNVWEKVLSGWNWNIWQGTIPSGKNKLWCWYTVWFDQFFHINCTWLDWEQLRSVHGSSAELNVGSGMTSVLWYDGRSSAPVLGCVTWRRFPLWFTSTLLNISWQHSTLLKSMTVIVDHWDCFSQQISSTTLSHARNFICPKLYDQIHVKTIHHPLLCFRVSAKYALPNSRHWWITYFELNALKMFFLPLILLCVMGW